MGLAFPGESDEYRVARDELLARERDLRRALEDVAIARRALPPGGKVPDDYVFREMRNGSAVAVRLSELFSPVPPVPAVGFSLVLLLLPLHAPTNTAVRQSRAVITGRHAMAGRICG
jgi:hypothetical protein